MSIQKTKIVTIEAGKSLSQVFQLVGSDKKALAVEFDGTTNIENIRIRARATPKNDGSDLPIATFLTPIPYADGEIEDLIDYAQTMATDKFVLKMEARSAFQIETLDGALAPLSVTDDLKIKIAFWSAG